MVRGEDYYKGLRMKSDIDSNSKNQGKESKSSLNKTMAEHYSDSHLSGGHLSYLDKLYETFLTNPDVISKDWKDLFVSLSETDDIKDEIIYSEVVDSFKNKVREQKNNIAENKKLSNGFFQKTLPLTINGKVNYFINAYRNFGHTAADLDPLQLAQKDIHIDLIYAEKLLEGVSLEGASQMITLKAQERKSF